MLVTGLFHARPEGTLLVTTYLENTTVLLGPSCLTEMGHKEAPASTGTGTCS